MGQPPEDIATIPTRELHLNAPFNIRTIYNFRLINTGNKRIGFAFKTTKPKRIFLNPPCGTVGVGDTVNVIITVATFDPNNEDIKNDRVIVEWCNTPGPSDTVFKLEWFGEDGMVRRKNLPVIYNL
ncbi:hypothetical protein niasHT_030839 [Heterodera trifolii]|uniref:Major sperm protein n=1 Tax=Heterodera trifolii TaxID=157864 RepID=A0ABD2HQ79_9BILA